MSVSTHLTIGGLPPVRRIGLGGNKFCGPDAWGPPRDVAEAVTVVRVACDSGIDLIDTAGSYGPGWSEEIVGRALAGRSDRPVVATKVGQRHPAARTWTADGRPERLVEEARDSMRRLGRGHLDLVQLHCVDPAVPIEESLGALWDLRDRGEVREVGVCNVSAEQLARAVRSGRIASVQNRLSLLRLDEATLAVVDACAAAGSAFLAHQPFDHGQFFLSGALEDAPRRLARSAVGQLVLRLLLEVGRHVALIPGSADVGHIRANLGALHLELAGDEMTGVLHGLPDAVAARRRILGVPGGADELPPRLGATPHTTIEVPQQQITQNGVPGARDELIRRTSELPGVRVRRTLLAIPGTVAFHVAGEEPPGDGLMAGTEFLHFHPPHDGSLHAVFSAEDHAELLAKRWALPHLLTGYVVHDRSLLVWAPRDRSELEICWQIIRRAHRYAMSAVTAGSTGAHR
ncbi:aldo/keto reductase [Streptomyces sp. NPDC102283]|uniref:aldo/keto reductase n=1 Tax=Streptomyces sp. NPDC102283 TaxID=3366155 RepID=UPI003811225D